MDRLFLVPMVDGFLIVLWFLLITKCERFFTKNHKEQSSQYDFSVIMSVYNMEKYISEAVTSLLEQTIGFADHVQLIFVNDGSTDSSESICLQYKKMFPHNIDYIFKPNGGLSSARNIGLKHVKGRYVNFLDPDDKWSPNALKEIQEFLEMHQDVDIVAGRMQYFEASTRFHLLDYKFNATRVVDITREYDCIQLSVASAFIKATSINGLQFLEQISSAEDARFINTILLGTGKYGLVREAVYYYRQRKAGTSLVQNRYRDKSFFLTTPVVVFQYLLNISKSVSKKAVPYIQYLTLYDLQGRLLPLKNHPLTSAELINYLDVLRQLIKEIDDHIILTYRGMNLEWKLFCLEQKYDYNINSKLTLKNMILYFDSFPLFSPTNYSFFRDRVKVDYNSTNLIVSMHEQSILPQHAYNIGIQTPQAFYRCSSKQSLDYKLQTVFGSYPRSRSISCSIPLRTENQFQLVLALNDGKVSKVHVGVYQSYLAVNSTLGSSINCSHDGRCLVKVGPQRRCLVRCKSCLFLILCVFSLIFSFAWKVSKHYLKKGAKLH